MQNTFPEVKESPCPTLESMLTIKKKKNYRDIQPFELRSSKSNPKGTSWVVPCESGMMRTIKVLKKVRVAQATVTSAICPISGLLFFFVQELLFLFFK